MDETNKSSRAKTRLKGFKPNKGQQATIAGPRQVMRWGAAEQMDGAETGGGTGGKDGQTGQEWGNKSKGAFDATPS